MPFFMLTGGCRTKGVIKKSQQGFPIISIVTVTYNGAKYLQQAIESIVGQSHTNFELIIIDGGSTDDTLKIIDSFGDSVDYWQSEPDKGIYDAMNKGIAFATGDWIGFKNADDWYCEGAFQCLAEHAEKQKEVDIWYGNTFSVVQEKPLYLAPFFTDHHSLGGNPGIDHRSCFIRLELHRKVLFNTNYRLAADFDVFWRLKKKSAVFGHLNQFISCKRYGGASDGPQILVESFEINRINAGILFAIKSRLKGWFDFMKWKFGNFVLSSLLGREGFLKFKSRKIQKNDFNTKQKED